MTHERSVTIAPDHPSLAGHFPGHPVVPGVLVMDEVIETLREHCGRDLIVTGLPSVKLSTPLLPGERLLIDIAQEETEIAAFTCRVGQRIVAAGSIRFRLPADDPAMTP